MNQPSAVLLDTCALIWPANGNPIPGGAMAAIIRAGLADGIYASVASAREIGLLSRPRPGRQPAVQCHPDPKTWFAAFMSGPGIREAPMTAAIAIDASYLPGAFHADPTDRMIVATARALSMPLVTGDHKILAYAAAGHVQVIAC